jgi:class 3 adenylate cyclase
MAALIFDSPVFTQVAGGPSDTVSDQPDPLRIGDKNADNLADHALTAHSPRIAVIGSAASALLTPAHCKELTVATVRGDTGRIANTLARSKRQLDVGDSHATETLKGTLHARFIAAETTHAAVLFADMRGYTGLAERLPCARVVPLLDEFFTILARVTVAFGGQVFHMAGDGMMAGFGVSDPRRSGAGAALAAGNAMLRRFAPVATRWRDDFAVVIGIGIGHHLGEVALGLLGPPGKQAITMIGDTANVAARLCGRARAGEVLFSGAIAAALVADGDGPGIGPKPFLQLPQFELRGRSQLLDIWCVPALERLAHRQTPTTFPSSWCREVPLQGSRASGKLRLSAPSRCQAVIWAKRSKRGRHSRHRRHPRYQPAQCRRYASGAGPMPVPLNSSHPCRR